MSQEIKFNEADHAMANKLIELRICLTRAITIIDDLADKTELTEEQKDDFVRITNVIKTYATDSIDTSMPN